MTIQKGKTAPAFTLPDAEGNKVSLMDFIGRHVILYFYPKDNTSGWIKEAAGFRDLYGQFQKLDTVILGVSPDNEASHQKFISGHDIPFSLLCDPEKKVMETPGQGGANTEYQTRMAMYEEGVPYQQD